MVSCGFIRVDIFLEYDLYFYFDVYICIIVLVFLSQEKAGLGRSLYFIFFIL